MRMRASGERSSCEAFASSVLCAPTRPSMRSAERLKLAASAATSSLPSTFTRAVKSPLPSASTLERSRSRRRVAPRTTGYAPTATASAISPSVKNRLHGASGGRSRRGRRAASQRPSGSSSVQMRPGCHGPLKRRRPSRGASRSGPTCAIRAPSGAYSAMLIRPCAESRSSAACCAASGAVARRQRALRDLGREVEAGRGRGGDELAPQEAGDEHEHDQARDDREVELEIEVAHQPSSCSLAKT